MIIRYDILEKVSPNPCLTFFTGKGSSISKSTYTRGGNKQTKKDSGPEESVEQPGGEREAVTSLLVPRYARSVYIHYLMLGAIVVNVFTPFNTSSPLLLDPST